MQGKYQENFNYIRNNGLNKLLLEGTWGLEKESLRVNKQGGLALTPHPEVFGDKTTNPVITTDFSESQLEIITPPLNSIEDTYHSLTTIHNHVKTNLDGELIWPLSMPANLPDDDQIPIAKFNNSNEGRVKEIYRSGLALRYGKKMQVISGIHYNFSFSDNLIDILFNRYSKGENKRLFQDDLYFSVVRNYFRYQWLLIYLFGASPVVDESFTKNCSCMDVIKQYLDTTTSLRMSQFGYSNSVQSSHYVSYNSLTEYISDLRKMLSTKNKDFSKLGIYKNGKQVQLNDNLLQLENELYSSVRFKQSIKKGERMFDALEKRGVRYIELRTFDLDPFQKHSLSIDQLYFIHLFIIYSLLQDSPKLNKDEQVIINRNTQTVALQGRKDNIILQNNNQDISLKVWAEEIFENLKEIAVLLDEARTDTRYQNSIQTIYKSFKNPEKLPSARILSMMKNKKESFVEFGIRMAQV